MNLRAILIVTGLLAVFFFTGMIEPCEDGHKCPPSIQQN